MASGISDYFLAYGNKNDFQERMICNLWLLLLSGYICYQFPSLVVVVWLVSPDFITAQTKKSFGLDHTSEEQLLGVVTDSDGSNRPQKQKGE